MYSTLNAIRSQIPVILRRKNLPERELVAEGLEEQIRAFTSKFAVRLPIQRVIVHIERPRNSANRDKKLFLVRIKFEMDGKDYIFHAGHRYLSKALHHVFEKVKDSFTRLHADMRQVRLVYA